MVAHTGISSQSRRKDMGKNSVQSNGNIKDNALESFGSDLKDTAQKHEYNKQIDPVSKKSSVSWRKMKPIHRTISKKPADDCNILVTFFTFLSYGVLFLISYVKEFFFPPSVEEKNREIYVPLYIGFESFYSRTVYRRIHDCFNRPVASVPGAYIDLRDRYSDDYRWTMKLTGGTTTCINVGSYNYLGFAENSGPCHSASRATTLTNGFATCSPRLELGNIKILNDLESLVAEYLGVEDAITFGMGFATNVLNIPALLDHSCLVLSDENNHASLILGLRLSEATCKVFRHNDCDDLEKKLRYNIIRGHPRTGRAWKKVLIVVEGIYSVEGTICNLPRLIELKKKYKAYLYVDEAHSIGAIGPNGGGITDFFGCDPTDIDILMGTFTKSFGSAGGYIAGKKELIDYIRVSSHAQFYAASMSPPIAQQIITSVQIIMGRDGTNAGRDRIQRLSRNVTYFRKRLKQKGFIVIGDDYSPVVPLMFYMMPKLPYFVRGLLDRGVAAVGVGFPASKLTGSRMRFCLSASHNKEILDEVLEKIDEVGTMCSCKHSYLPRIIESVEW